MIKRYTTSIYFDLYMDAAKKLGIDFFQLTSIKTAGYFDYKGKRLYILGNQIGINNSVSHVFAKYKDLTYQILDKGNYPHPKAVLIGEDANFNKLLELVKNLKKPLVVKPLIGFGGHGVSVDLTTEEQLKNAVPFARQYCRNILIEELVMGTNYRILIVKGEILDVLKRIPANITGNGKDTIQALISAKNKIRSKYGMKPIKVDAELAKVLAKNKLTLDSVLKQNTLLYLRENCNFSTGGEVERIDLSYVHKDNQALFKDSINLIGLDYAGIDFISPDISKSYKDTTCAINEINKAAMIDIHYFADMKMDNSVAEKILKIYFDIKNK